jgi:endonuclease I
MPAFGKVYPFHSSTSLRYTVSGAALSSDLVITAPAGFEVSETYGYGYTQAIRLIPVSGSVPVTTIFVRFSPSATGVFSGTVTNTSTGSTSQTVSVSGNCIAWDIPASPVNYYSSVTTQRGAALKTALYNKISTGNTIGNYASIWTSFQTTDVQPNGKVWDVYATRFDVNSPYEYTMSSDQCGSYSIESDCYNREHSFPKSWFNDASPMHNDLLHVLASDGKVNGMRNNYPYGNVTSASFTSLYGGKLGTGATSNFGYTGTVFEPIDEYKGDVARGYFYMATRYENLIAGWISNTGANDVLNGTSFPAYDPWHVSLLLSWHNLDPVSDKEMKRNNAIAAIQNTRNPFIDSPHFAQRIWGGSIPAEPTLSASDLTVTNNSNTSVTLNWKSGNGNRRIVLVSAGSPVSAFPVDTVAYNNAGTVLSSAQQTGPGNYVVYNGTGSTVTLTGLTQGTTYHYAVIEYNGWYTTSNYQATGFLTSSATTLPVNLLSFTAERAGEHVLLRWTTAGEQNNRDFTVEKSTDLRTWQTAGKVDGAGTTQLKRNYLLTDIVPDPAPATVYYRLKQTDFDDRFTYSSTAAVNFHTADPVDFTVAPNPFTDKLRISYTGNTSGTVRITLQNLIGEIYVTQTNDIQNRSESFIDLDNPGTIPAGIYVLQLEYGNETFRHKLIKR